jgi:hypothetical protein
MSWPAGYEHIAHSGIDSEIGCIVKFGGPIVHYELCCYNGWIDQAFESPSALWKRTLPLKIRGENVKMAMFANGNFYVAAGGDAYHAENVRTQADLADVPFVALGTDYEARDRELTQELKRIREESARRERQTSRRGAERQRRLHRH